MACDEVDPSPRRRSARLASVLGRRRGRLHLVVTVAWGDKERLIPAKTRRRDELPVHTRFVALTDCGHNPMWDDPELVAGTILAGIGARSTRDQVGLERCHHASFDCLPRAALTESARALALALALALAGDPSEAPRGVEPVG